MPCKPPRCILRVNLIAERAGPNIAIIGTGSLEGFGPILAWIRLAWLRTEKSCACWSEASSFFVIGPPCHLEEASVSRLRQTGPNCSRRSIDPFNTVKARKKDRVLSRTGLQFPVATLFCVMGSVGISRGSRIFDPRFHHAFSATEYRTHAAREPRDRQSLNVFT